MSNQLLPQRADNAYRGHKVALVIFGLVLIAKAGISLGSMFNGHTAASSADGIPIDTYTSAGARTVLSLFAVLGLSNLIICLMGTVVLIRYRGLIPFMFALYLMQQLGRDLILRLLPIARTGAPPGSAINLTILGLIIVGLALSLWIREGGRPNACKPHEDLDRHARPGPDACAHMTRRRIVLILLVLGASFDPNTLRAQCVPEVQRLIADRKHDEARAELEAQLKRAPGDDAAMECMGRLRLEQGESGDAVDWLDKAVKINGRSAQHQMWLGNALLTQGEKASILRRPFIVRRMKTAYERAVALDPTLVDARRGLVTFYSLAPSVMGGGMAKAREQAAEILKLNPMRGHIAYATIAERDKDYTGAEKEFLVAVAATPDSAVAHIAIGSFYRRRERWTEAIAMYEKALMARPDAVSASIAHYYLGMIHQQNGRRDQARAEYQAALAANPNSEDAKNALALLK